MSTLGSPYNQALMDMFKTGNTQFQPGVGPTVGSVPGGNVPSAMQGTSFPEQGQEASQGQKDLPLWAKLLLSTKFGISKGGFHGGWDPGKMMPQGDEAAAVKRVMGGMQGEEGMQGQEAQPGVRMIPGSGGIGGIGGLLESLFGGGTGGLGGGQSPINPETTSTSSIGYGAQVPVYQPPPSGFA